MASGELGRELSSENIMANQLKTGDRVAWQSSGGGSAGRVERKLTSPGKIKGHEVAASPDNPEFLVRSDKSGKVAAHKPSALRRVK
jgi:Hypervirulence associated proteins TUDOR domain